MAKLNEAFWRWFGDSKVVDAQGQPLVVYHGTRRDFSIFEAAQQEIPAYLYGFYFTSEKWYAEKMLALHQEDRGEQRIMRVYLSLKNPFVGTTKDIHRMLKQAVGAKAYRLYGGHENAVKALSERLRQEGFDGAILEGMERSGFHGRGEPRAVIEYIAFLPEQIKSATSNDGTWDTDDSNIRSNPSEDMGDAYLIRGDQVVPIPSGGEHVRFILENTYIFGIENDLTPETKVFEILFDEGWVRVRRMNIGGIDQLALQGGSQRAVRDAASTHVSQEGYPEKMTMEFPGIFREWNTAEEMSDFMTDGLSRNPEYSGTHEAPTHDGYSAPLYDVSGPGIYPEDIYGPNGAQYYGHSGGDALDRAAVSVMRSYRNNPNSKVTIYRAVPAQSADKLALLEKQMREFMRRGKSPEDSPLTGSDWYNDAHEVAQALRAAPAEEILTINPGDWVTTVRAYAVQHGESSLAGAYRVISKSVYARDLFTDGNSIFEFGYDPQPRVTHA